MDKLGNCGRVKVYYTEAERLLVIMAVKEGEADTQKLNKNTKPTRLNSVGVRKVAEQLLSFKVGDRAYRVSGEWKLDEEYEYWMFDMSKAMEVTRSTSKGENIGSAEQVAS